MIKLHRQETTISKSELLFRQAKEPASTLVIIIAYPNLSFINSENKMMFMIGYLGKNY